MNGRRALVTICSLLLLLAGFSAVQAQDAQCPVGDHACLSERFRAACRASRSPETADTCAAWLTELQQRPDIGSAPAEILLGNTYWALSNLSEETAVAETYRGQAATIFRQLLDRWPGDVLSLGGLRATSVDQEEILAYIRRAVAYDPTNLMTVELAGREMIARPGDAAMWELLDIQETAYAAVDPENDRARLELAVGIWVSYHTLVSRMAESDPPAAPSRIAQVEAGRAAFLDRLRADLHFDSRLEEFNAAPIVDPGRTAASLTTLCHRDALSTLGPHDCIESLTILVEQVAASDGSAPALEVADAVATTMSSVNQLPALMREYPDIDARFHESMARWLSGGIETGTVYTTFARFAPDAGVRFDALERASTRFPTDGNVAEMLAWDYMQRGRQDQAIEQLLIARDNLPERVHTRIENSLRRARGEDEATPN